MVLVALRDMLSIDMKYSKKREKTYSHAQFFQTLFSGIWYFFIPAIIKYFIINHKYYIKHKMLTAKYWDDGAATTRNQAEKFEICMSITT
jgi:hypothetical protein